jgi:hypothetical protein
MSSFSAIIRLGHVSICWRYWRSLRFWFPEGPPYTSIIYDLFPNWRNWKKWQIENENDSCNFHLLGPRLITETFSSHSCSIGHFRSSDVVWIDILLIFTFCTLFLWNDLGAAVREIHDELELTWTSVRITESDHSSDVSCTGLVPGPEPGADWGSLVP